MALASISQSLQSLKTKFEGYIPQLSSPKAIVLTGAGATLAYQLYQRSLAGTLLAGAAFAATACCLHLRERVTLINVESHLNQLDRDVTISWQKGDFNSKKALFISRFDKIQAVLAKNQALIPEDKWKSIVKLMNVIRASLTTDPSKAAPLPKLSSTQVVNGIIASLTTDPSNASPLPKLFLTPAINDHIFSFLGPKEVARTANVSRRWLSAVDSESQWKLQCRTLIPGVKKPPGTTYKQLARDAYPKVLGGEFYHDYYGVDVGPVPPIPPQFLEKADAVILVPQYFTMRLPEDSPLGLDQDGKLTTNSNEYHNRPQAVNGQRVLQVPVTLNNLDILTRRHLKKGAPTGIDPTKWQNILQQHGNAHFPSHWSGQKRALMGKGLPFVQQQTAAQEAGLEVVPSLDRVLFNLLTHLRLGTFVENPENAARTATIVLDNDNNPWQTTVCPLDPSSGLRLYSYFDFISDRVGVAVGVPSGSS